MKKSLGTLYTMALLLATAGCTAIGPHPSMLVLSSEIKAQPRITHLVVVPTLGTGSNDPEEPLNRIVPAGAFQRYGEIIILSPALGATVGTLGMPENSGPPLAANWQLRFYKLVKAGAVAKKDAKIEVPEATMRVAQSDIQIGKLARLLRRREKDLDALGAALKRSDPEELVKAEEPHAKGLAAVEQLFRHLTRRLKVSHVLTSWVDGDAEAFQKNRPVTLHVALINVRTGIFRWYAKSSGRKGDIPANYRGFLGIMTKNLFEDIERVDEFEPE